MPPIGTSLETLEGTLFDIYHIEEQIYLWVKVGTETVCLVDRYYPEFFIHGSASYEAKFIARLKDLNALHTSPEKVTKRDFYGNNLRTVTKIVLSKPSVLRTISYKLSLFYNRLEIYHSDLDVTTAYLLQKDIFPLTPVRFYFQFRNQIREVVHAEGLASTRDLDYSIPDFRRLEIRYAKNHRIGCSANNPLIFSKPKLGSDHLCEEEWTVYSKDPKALLNEINSILKTTDPDIIVSAFGDHSIFPFLFGLSQQFRIPLLLDREPGRIQRKIVTKGTSFETYGNMIYRAPSYPLFGRLHIDSSNSFVFKESMLHGIFELSRLSRIPIQRMGRASTGTALTNIETEVAFQKNYLVPWQKAAIEQTKSAYELLRNDKGGLVFLPDVSENSIYENVAQLDFAQMYPSIMAHYNISPETINCRCCQSEPNKVFVPGTEYVICQKRRGVVSDALEHILDRRKYYKKKIKEESSLSPVYEARQNALKWMLVTSFGYLGYRNAKFGRIESHESVTAIGREVLLLAKETAEARGYVFLHAITDSIFIRKADNSAFGPSELPTLCSEISELTKIELKIEGTYDWLIFPASKQDSELAVVNRYFGKFSTGELKVRGIFSRRKDIPLFIKSAQSQMLAEMQTCKTKSDLQRLAPKMETLVDTFRKRLESGQVPLEELLLRRTVTQSREDYKNTNPASASLLELEKLDIEVNPGEKVRYLVTQGHKKKRIYIPEEVLHTKSQSYIVHLDYYRGLLVECLKEVFEHLADDLFFSSLLDRQLLLPF